MTVQAELLSDEERRKVEELIEQEDGAVHKFAGWWGKILTGIAAVMTLFHLYAAASTVDSSRCARSTSPSHCHWSSCCSQW